MHDDEDSDGVTQEELKKALREVRGKKALFKLNHKLKKNLRARSKNKKLDDFEEHLEKKGIDADIEAIRARAKKRRGIKELEDNQDKKVGKALADTGDAMMADEERVGRKRRRSMSSNEDMESSSEDDSRKKRSMTPAQLKLKS
jgi:hypothetical protein